MPVVEVLILVVVEDVLVLRNLVNQIGEKVEVLILVVVEDVLVPLYAKDCIVSEIVS